jgi:beta-glucosidase
MANSPVRAFRAVAAVLAITMPTFAQMSDLPPYRQQNLPVEVRIADLLSRMTLEEKVHQLHQGSVGDTNPNNLGARTADFRPTYGSYIVGGPSVIEIRELIQRQAMNESRLGIPAIFGADVIHGWRAITPIPLAQACTWNPELIRRGAAMAAAEARAQGVDWTFAPMVDHCVDPRWGRIAETFGESPYASGVFAAASVLGYQGERLGEPESIASCLKHYVGYGASEGGRDYSYTEVAPQTLWERHLPAFEAGVRAGARTVMSAFNDLNGIPTSANRFTLTDVLRERWGFDGLVVSDWNAVLQLIQQGFAADETEAVEKAILAGVDLDMADGLYVKHLAALVESGRVPMDAVDEAVRRVLRVKFELGLFELPFARRSELTNAAPNSTQLELAEEIAAQSMVLLKNDGVLPLRNTRRIALIGPLARHSHALLGSWAQQGRSEETPSIHDALVERMPAGVTLRFEPGCNIHDTTTDGFAAAAALARESDVVVLCLGEEAWMSGENASRSTLRLPGRQEDLALQIAAIGKPVVLIIVSGRPVELQAVADEMDAIVAAWQGGSRAGAALADLLLGRRNFSGKLAVTWPRTTGQIPLYHHMRPRARLGEEGAYRDLPTTPLFDFGHGLSYTRFEYSPIRLDRSSVTSADRVVAEVTVTNCGERSGEEAVLWFIRDPAASITRPLKQLKHFEKAALAPRESRVFRFEIQPQRDLTFPDAEGRLVLEAGEILLLVGSETQRFHVTTP